MSRSRRRTPIFGFTCAESEKSDKRFANRRTRRRVRAAVEMDAEVMPLVREVSNEWGFAKDGKHWRGEWKRSKWMRK